MNAYTGNGDNGFTELLYRQRVRKDSDDICLLGDLDELNCFLGLVKCRLRSRKEKAGIEMMQYGIYAISSEVAVGQDKRRKMGPIVKKEDIDRLHELLTRSEKRFRGDRCFVLPGNNELSALLDIARAVARRAERNAVKLFGGRTSAGSNILAYMNCLSDILFLMARDKDSSIKKKKVTSQKRAKRLKRDKRPGHKKHKGTR